MFHSHEKTVLCDPTNYLPALWTESGVEKLHALFSAVKKSLMQDGRVQENLTHAQWKLLHSHSRPVHAGIDKIKSLSRQGLPPKEIITLLLPHTPV